MPRYFFDLHNDVDVRDDEGKNLPDSEAAHLNAFKEAREMICSSVTRDSKIDLRHSIDVRDEGGTIVYVVHFEDAVMVSRGEEILSRSSGAA